MTSHRATTLTVMPSSLLTLNEPGWKHATMSLRFDSVVCTASLRPSLTMSQRSSVKTGPPDSNRCPKGGLKKKGLRGIGGWMKFMLRCYQPICYWHELLDLIFFLKITHDLVNVHLSVLPDVRKYRRTRSTTTNIKKYIPKKCKTTTYQKSFLVRACRIWNCLADELDFSFN